MIPFLDDTVFHALNRSVANPAFDAVFPILTALHQQKWCLVSVAAVAVVALWKGDRRARLWVVAALLSVGASDLVCSKGIKRFVERQRPCQSVALGDTGALPFNVRVVNPDRCPGSRSFPSNHAANMAALGIVCGWFTRGRKRWLWGLLPLVIGYTRIYLGYHYPSDVVGGWVVGALIASMVLALARKALDSAQSPSA